MDYTEYESVPHYYTPAALDSATPDELKAMTDDPRIKWSGKAAPPAIGAKVHVRMNGLGNGVVTSYFTECGWLGVKVKFDAPPAWYIKQNGKSTPGHVFGADITD